MLHLKWGFERTINWNKYQSKVTVQERNGYLDYLINPCFLEVNGLFVLSFENNSGRASYSRYYVPQKKINDCNVMIGGQNFFDQAVTTNLRTNDNTWKIATGEGDVYTTGCLLDYLYFKTYYKMIAIDLSKQQELDANPIAIK